MERLMKQWLLREGTYSGANGQFKVTAENIRDIEWCINRRALLGVPVALKYTHRQDAEAIPVGTIINAMTEAGELYADLVLLHDAETDTGEGSRIVATQERMREALEQRTMQLSLEGGYDVTNSAYYGDRKLTMEVTAWAILPAGVLPAVPPEKIAASKDAGDTITFIASKDNIQGGIIVEEKLAELLQKLNELDTRVKAIEESGMEEEPAEEEAPEEEASTEPELETAATDKDVGPEVEAGDEPVSEPEPEQQTGVTELLRQVLTKLLPAERMELEKSLATDGAGAQPVLEAMNRTLKPVRAKAGKLEISPVENTGDKTEEIYAEMNTDCDRIMAEKNITKASAVDIWMAANPEKRNQIIGGK